MTFDKPAIKTRILGLTTVIGFFLFGCGKPIQHGSEETVTRTPALTNSTEYIFSQSDADTYVFPKAGQVYIPAQLSIISDNKDISPAMLQFHSGDSNHYTECMYQYKEEIEKGPAFVFDTCYLSEREKGDLLVRSPSDWVKIISQNEVKVDLEIIWP